MSDDLALKLLVAGIIGAVVGAAAAERYHFPTGLVYGGLNRQRPQPAIDQRLGLGRAEEGPIVYEVSPPPEPPQWEPPQPRYYYYRPPVQRSAPRFAPPRAALCYREHENWNFAPSGHHYRCAPGSANRVYRGDG